MKTKNKKIKLAFIKYNGITAGGTQRWLQNLAVGLDKNKFEVDYFYTGIEDPDRLKFLQENNVNLIKLQGNGRATKYGEWIGTDLFQKFDENNYDLIQDAIAGENEWPFHLLKKPLVESVHLDYGVNFSPNVLHTILLSKWNQNKWAKMGGVKFQSSIAPLGLEMPYSDLDLREELNIPKDALVAGFHQRVDDNTFSPIPVYAYKANEAENHYFIIMGGSKKYTELAQKLNLKNFIQLEHCANKERISKFLNTLDIFAHGRHDGETFGYVITEALIHKKPCIVHKAVSNAQKETMGPGGLYAKTQKQYNKHLERMFKDTKLREDFSMAGFEYAKKKFIETDYIRQIEKKYEDIVKNPQKYRILRKIALILKSEIKFKNIMQRIFSVQNVGVHKVVCIMGLKFKFRFKSLVQRAKIEKLNNKLKANKAKIKKLKQKSECDKNTIDNMQQYVSKLERHYLDKILSNIEKEKFSVIIPTLQKDINILNMLVKSLIEDEFVDEILIIDNSLKGGLAYNSSKVRVLPVEKNLYVYPAWNYGIENIKNEYFAILNDDLLLSKNFFAQVSDFIKETPDCGLVGLESSTVIDKNDNDFDEYPETSILFFKSISDIHEEHNYYWGSAIFGKKENYHAIPQDMLIWAGDKYLLLKNTLQNKKCYAIYNTKIKHYGSLSSKNFEFDEIKKRDAEAYCKLENSLIAK